MLALQHPTRKLTVKESIAVDIQARDFNSDRTQQQQIIHHHHHHHHHHHDDALQAETIIIANSSGEHKSSNVVGDKKDHLMLENNQPVSGMIDLNAQPRHLLSQASLADKVMHYLQQLYDNNMKLLKLYEAGTSRFPGMFSMKEGRRQGNFNL